jgi:hypothetical protein
MILIFLVDTFCIHVVFGHSAAIMFSSSLLFVVLAGAAIAFTPAGFQPASSNNLTVVFGNTLAVNGKNILKAGKQSLQSSPAAPHTT